MKPDLDVLVLIQARFPGRDELIERALGDNATFRDLCVDYLDCAATLEYLGRGDVESGSIRRDEYAELMEQLRQEIEAWLEAHRDAFTLSRGDSR